MPKVGNKHFSYSPKGVKAAQAYAMKDMKDMKMDAKMMNASKPVKTKKK